MSIAAGEIRLYVCASAKTICVNPTIPLSLTANPVTHFASVYASAVDRVMACSLVLDYRPEAFPTAILDEFVPMRKGVSNALRDLN